MLGKHPAPSTLRFRIKETEKLRDMKEGGSYCSLRSELGFKVDFLRTEFFAEVKHTSW